MNSFIETYECNVNFDILKNHQEYLVQGIVNTTSGARVDKTIKDCKEYCKERES